MWENLPLYQKEAPLTAVLLVLLERERTPASSMTECCCFGSILPDMRPVYCRYAWPWPWTTTPVSWGTSPSVVDLTRHKNKAVQLQTKGSMTSAAGHNQNHGNGSKKATREYHAPASYICMQADIITGRTKNTKKGAKTTIGKDKWSEHEQTV